MKFTFTSAGSPTTLLLPVLAAGLLSVASAAAVPVDKSGLLTARQDPAWSFSVYQSSQMCTGARDPYSGSGSQGCTRGIRNGSFGSYTRGDIQPGCSIYLYNNDECRTDGIIDVLTSDTPEG